MKTLFDDIDFNFNEISNLRFPSKPDNTISRAVYLDGNTMYVYTDQWETLSVSKATTSTVGGILASKSSIKADYKYQVTNADGTKIATVITNMKSTGIVSGGFTIEGKSEKEDSRISAIAFLGLTSPIIISFEKNEDNVVGMIDASAVKDANNDVYYIRVSYDLKGDNNYSEDAYASSYIEEVVSDTHTYVQVNYNGEAYVDVDTSVNPATTSTIGSLKVSDNYTVYNAILLSSGITTTAPLCIDSNNAGYVEVLPATTSTIGSIMISTSTDYDTSSISGKTVSWVNLLNNKAYVAINTASSTIKGSIKIKDNYTTYSTLNNQTVAYLSISDDYGYVSVLPATSSTIGSVKIGSSYTTYSTISNNTAAMLLLDSNNVGYVKVLPATTSSIGSIMISTSTDYDTSTISGSTIAWLNTNNNVGYVVVKPATTSTLGSIKVSSTSTKSGDTHRYVQITSNNEAYVDVPEYKYLAYTKVLTQNYATNATITADSLPTGCTFSTDTIKNVCINGLPAIYNTDYTLASNGFIFKIALVTGDVLTYTYFGATE